MQRRPRHLGDVLPADGKVDLDAGVDLPSGLLARRSSACATRCSTCSFDISMYAGLCILQAAADGLQRARGEARIFRDQAIPGRRGPGERDAIDGGNGGRRIVCQIHRLRDAEQLAGRDVADDGLLPLRRGLFDAKMAVKQDVEAIGFHALIEDGAALRVSSRPRFPQQFVLFGGRKASEHRQALRPVSGRLRPSIPSFQI